jgi:SAM-dependent methyltransferase
MMPGSGRFYIKSRNAFLYAAGLGFLGLAKAKNVLRGYTSPKPFDLSETDKCVTYDMRVVDEWLTHLAAYTRGAGTLQDMNVLELGPGSDLGVGTYLLAKGAATYNACDVNDLARHAPEGFYTALIERIRAADPGADVPMLQAQIRAARAGTPSRLKLIVRDDFNLLAAFAANSMDLVFSQAAFEHFDDVDATVAQLSAVCKPGAVIVAEIDLKTHTRWIRDKDPNNIYRYSDRIYRSFWFRGAPNRMRPYQYKEIFERNGWANVSIEPLEQIASDDRDASVVDRNYHHERNQLEMLSVVLCATKL